LVKQSLAIVLCTALVTTGCASAGVRVAQAPATPLVDQQVMREYVQQIPAGSRVRVEQIDGGSFRATLMKATADAIVVQKSTRIPEPPIEVPLARVTRVTLDNGSHGSTGRAIGIGVAAGVGGVLAFFAILAATFSD
jgi:hypothetical protein